MEGLDSGLQNFIQAETERQRFQVYRGHQLLGLVKGQQCHEVYPLAFLFSVSLSNGFLPSVKSSLNFANINYEKSFSLRTGKLEEVGRSRV